MTVESISISPAQTLEFARLSGDRNPLHVDPLAARRSVFGGTVAHGMHATLAALDCILAKMGESRSITSIQVAYTTGLPQGEEARLAIEADDENGTALRILAGTRQIQTLRIRWANRSRHTGSWPGDALPPEEEPHVVDPDAAASAEGEVPALADLALASRLFPSLVRLLPPGQLAAMLASTRIVGMRCPGMHSIFSGVKLKFDGAHHVQSLGYSVRRYSPGANFLTLTLRGDGVEGEINAFFRPAPVLQPTFGELRDRVPKGQFAGQRALIIGGSRGLGELCAKLLAAGGAEVLLTWHSGEADAVRIVEDISEGGGVADAMQWDCMAPPSEAPARLSGMAPTHFYYFATPRIELNRSEQFDRQIFDRYVDTYVVGLERSFSAAKTLWTPCECTYLFSPSTVFLESPDASSVEYAAAKAAAEVTAREIANRAEPKLTLRSPRLPRVLTDQTNSVSAIKPQSATEVLLAEIM